ncbi:MAG: DNA phosphorothioation-associated putative methyltransferase [Burkholderiales bacterium]
MSTIGKRVGDELYVHLSSIRHVANPEHRCRIESAVRLVPDSHQTAPNVAKINVRTGKLSLLAYSEFEHAPFPELQAAWTFAPGELRVPSYRHYRDSLNPPILHRKELLVGEDHPERGRWIRLTKAAEELGLFDDTTTIGFRLNWERLISERGYMLAGDSFVPLGNVVSGGLEGIPSGLDGPISRHLTALSRSNLSAPIQLLLRTGLLQPGTTVFDYGCGRGDDISGLVTNGFEARGWDPHFAPDHPLIEADVINLGFVVNVIEDAAERVEAVHRAFKLARRVMSVGVMLYGSEPPGRSFRDGFITSRNTFQKYFTQGEFKDYLEHVLHQEAFMAGPGVAFVFADKDLEQRYVAGRYRTRGVAARLLATRPPRIRTVKPTKERQGSEPKPPKVNRTEAELARVRPHLDKLWVAMLDLGRLPAPEEVKNLETITAQVGGLGKAVRLLAKLYDQSLLETAANTRSDDVRLYMAAQQFSRRPAYRQLEPRLQRDIKAFFGDYRTAQASGMRLLVEAADSATLLEACQQSAAKGIGWLEADHSLQLHVSLVERLPVVLRAYVACGLILWDAISDVQLIKIHIGSGKLTLMEFDDFDASPTPNLRRRVKVNVRKQDYDLFEYGTREYPKPLLYRKSRYLHEDYTGYAEQLAFDEALEATGILGESDFGPASDALADALEARRLGIVGMRLVRSERLPDLDQRCGANFTFRDFIECGETQLRLAVRNVPRNPQTYNALYDLAVHILDPLIDYFGAIKLTYGFCSAELGRHIHRRVAPALDQHAALEVNRLGRQICPRGGAACDFLVEHEDMSEVADWIIANTSFDRLYFYGADRPVHVSYSPAGARQAFRMIESKTGQLLPRKYR